MWRPRHLTAVHMKTQTRTQRLTETPTHSPVHFLKTVCGEEEALDFGMTGFEGTAVSQEEEDWLVFLWLMLCGWEQMCLISNFGDMWGTLTISVCTLWLGLFWTLGGWWSPQPSHPAGAHRWRVVVHHQHTEQTVIHTDIPISFGIVVLQSSIWK